MPRDPEFELNCSRCGPPSSPIGLDNRPDGVEGRAQDHGGCGAAAQTGVTSSSYPTDYCASLRRYLTEPRRDEMRALGLPTDAVSSDGTKIPSDVRRYLRYEDTSRLDVSIGSSKLSDDESWSATAEVDFPTNPMERYIYTKEPHEILALKLRHGIHEEPKQGATPSSDGSISLSAPSAASVEHSLPPQALVADPEAENLGPSPLVEKKIENFTAMRRQ